MAAPRKPGKGGDDIREAANFMAARMRAAGFDAVARSHVNPDGSADSEVRVFTRFRVTTGKTLMRMQGLTTVVSDAWATVLMIRPMPDEEVDTGQIWLGNRYAFRTHMHWISAGDRFKLAKLFINSAYSDLQSGKKKRRKVEQLIFRMHWNAAGERPEEGKR